MDEDDQRDFEDYNYQPIKMTRTDCCRLNVQHQRLPGVQIPCPEDELDRTGSGETATGRDGLRQRAAESRPQIDSSGKSGLQTVQSDGLERQKHGYL